MLFLSVPVATNQSLVSPRLWERLVARIVRDENIAREQAEQIMNSTIGFLILCANNPDKKFSPTHLVDIGWHTFLMYTRDYAEFCQAHGNQFIHHDPNDNPDRPMESGGARETVAFMQRHGIPHDPEMWRETNRNNCSDCDGGGGPGPGSDCTCS